MVFLMPQTIFALALIALFFLAFGELFYNLLLIEQSRVRPLWLVWILLVPLGPISLLIAGAQAEPIAALLICVMLFTIHVGFMKAAIRGFAESRGSQLTSDVPFYDPAIHPMRTALAILVIYWGVVAFFLVEFIAG